MESNKNVSRHIGNWSKAQTRAAKDEVDKLNHAIKLDRAELVAGKRVLYERNIQDNKKKFYGGAAGAGGLVGAAGGRAFGEKLSIRHDNESKEDYEKRKSRNKNIGTAIGGVVGGAAGMGLLHAHRGINLSKLRRYLVEGGVNSAK